MVAKDCSFCGREGLLIYPVRYAIACPAGADRAPELSGNFQIEGAPAEVATAKYTLRAIRTGYLYTYDEKRDRLKAYVVMPQGYLWNFPYKEPPPVLNSGQPRCSNPVDTALSMCVDVRHSEGDQAGILWIGWSNTAWTPALIKKVKNDEWRRKHMRGVDIPYMLTGLRDRHVGEFEKNYKSVSHFAMAGTEMKKAFSFSNTQISHETGRKDKAIQLINIFKMQTSIKKGFIVALDDPVGMTNDLSELTLPTDESGFNTQFYRGKIVEEVIRSAEKAVRDRARHDFDFDLAQKKIDERIPSADGVPYSDVKKIWEVVTAGGTGNIAKRKEDERKKYGVSEAGQRKAAEDRAWNELTIDDDKPVLDTRKLAEFPALYDSELKKFERNGVALAQAHAAWLKSDQLCRWMDGVHDGDDLSSGFAYRESLAQCIGKAAATNACDKQLNAWLSAADVENPTNLYARAMLFNQTEIINVVAPHIKGGDIKLKYILSIYKQGADRLKKGEYLRLIDRLVFSGMNSLLKGLGQNINLAMRNLAIINLSLLSRTVISVSNHSPHKIREWIVHEASEKGIKFDVDRGARNSNLPMAAQKTLNERLLHSGDLAYEIDVAQLEQEGRISPGSIKNVKIPSYKIIEDLFGSSRDFNAASVGVVLQFAAFAFAFRDFKNGDRFDNVAYFSKFAISVISLGGSFLELVGTTIEKAPTHPLAAALQSHWAGYNEYGKKVLALGKRASFLGGMLTAIFDFCMAIKSFKEGDDLLGVFYLTSSVLGASLAVAALIGSVVFWPLFMVSLVLAIIIAIAKESPLRKWFKHCFFASDYTPEKGYSTLEEELSALNNLLGA